jgi:hypothetical protein
VRKCSTNIRRYQSYVEEPRGFGAFDERLINLPTGSKASRVKPVVLGSLNAVFLLVARHVESICGSPSFLFARDVSFLGRASRTQEQQM